MAVIFDPYPRDSQGQIMYPPRVDRIFDTVIDPAGKTGRWITDGFMSEDLKDIAFPAAMGSITDRYL